MILLFGATNDSWLDRAIGEVKFADWTQEELRAVVPAYCHLLDYVTARNPQAEIFCVINDVLKPEISAGLKKAAEHYGVKAVMLEGVDKSNGHPTCLGMTQIAEQIDAPAGATVVGVATVVDRATGARDVIEAEGVEYRSLLGLSDLGLA